MHAQTSRVCWRMIVGLCWLLPLPASLFSAAPDSEPAEQNQESREAVHEALQREVYGLAADRERLLLAAVEAEPKAAQPRWYLGQVQSTDGTWQSAGKLPGAREGRLYREYRTVRDAKTDDAAAQRALADWCGNKGLKQQERAHLLRSLSLNPNQAEIRKRLGLVRVGDQWVEPTVVEREQQRRQAARAAYEHWLPIITKLAPQVSSPDSLKREAAIAQLLAINDVGALPALQSILASRGEAQQLLVLKVCEELHEPSATELIAWQATASPSPQVRRTAAQMLKPREQVDYAPLLISEMYSPVVTKVETVQFANGSLGLRRSFWREGADHHELFVSDVRFQPNPDRNILRDQGYLNALLEAENRAFAAARQATAQSEVAVAEQNRLSALRNDRISAALNIATGVHLPAQADAWWKWWMDSNELTFPDGKGVAAIYQRNQVMIESFTDAWTLSCFNAGTPVWTDQGPIAIERIRIGDLVLTRDVESGELTYKPVLQTTVRPKRLLTQLTVGDETIQATGGHLFWVSGTGWVRAKELQSGHVLHTAAAPISVVDVQPGIMAETYNLVVADFHTYFVGQKKLLSHDNTPRRPTRMIVPGLSAD